MKFKDYETIEDLKQYLDNPFHYTRKSVFHYTNLCALKKIFEEKRLKGSLFEKTNDITEARFVTEESLNKMNFIANEYYGTYKEKDKGNEVCQCQTENRIRTFLRRSFL